MVPRKMCSLNSLPVRLSLFPEFLNLYQRVQMPPVTVNALTDVSKHISEPLRKEGKNKATELLRLCIEAEIKTIRLKHNAVTLLQTSRKETFVAATKNTETYFLLQMKLYKYSMHYYSF